MPNTRRPPRDGYLCPYCEHVSRSEAESKRHRRRHTPEERIQTCPHCGKVFTHGYGAAFIGHVRAHEEFAKRFWEKVDKNAPNGCWEWRGQIMYKGYGYHTRGKRMFKAHRVAYELVKGPIPREFRDLDHLCLNKICVNPDHLEPVTHRENMRRALVKTHCKRGHEYTPENTRWYGGSRVCATCRLQRERERTARLKASDTSQESDT